MSSDCPKLIYCAQFFFYDINFMFSMKATKIDKMFIVDNVKLT